MTRICLITPSEQQTSCTEIACVVTVSVGGLRVMRFLTAQILGREQKKRRMGEGRGWYLTVTSICETWRSLTEFTISIAFSKSSSMPWYCIDINSVLIRIIKMIPASKALLSTTRLTRFLKGPQKLHFDEIPAPQHEQHFLIRFSLSSPTLSFVGVLLLAGISCGPCLIWKTEIDSLCVRVKALFPFSTVVWSNMALWIVSSRTTSCSPYTRLKTLRVRRENVEPSNFCFWWMMSFSWQRKIAKT